MTRLRKILTPLLVVEISIIAACIAMAAVTFTEVPDSARLERVAVANSAGPSLEIGPYVQKVTADAATIMWEANVPSFGEVRVSDGKTETKRRTSRAVRLGEVRIGGLRPDTVYSYSLTLSSQSKAAARGTFRTLPANPRLIKFIVYGDTRTSPERHKSVIDAMLRERNVDFVLHTGDLVADGRNDALWGTEFFTPAGPLMRSVPFYAVLGNHERDSSNYFRYLSLPGNERWYSFDLPGVHIIGLDSCSRFDEGSEQRKWLLEDLAEHKDVRWKFVFMHHPVYSSGPHSGVSADGTPKEKAIREARSLLPRLAAEFGISAVFAGHDHSYERSTRDGVHYIVAGGGGAPSYGDENARHNPYRKVFFAGLHYCVVAIDGDKGRIVVKTPAGKVLDKVELSRR
jgi:predicted phosphodiesterase